MILMQSAIVSGNDVDLEEAGCQGGCGEGKRDRFVKSDLAVVPMKSRQSTLHGVRLGPNLLAS